MPVRKKRCSARVLSLSSPRDHCRRRPIAAAFRKALAVSGERDGDLKMFFWACGSMLGLIVSGMSAAYILLPIILLYQAWTYRIFRKRLSGEADKLVY